MSLLFCQMGFNYLVSALQHFHLCYYCGSFFFFVVVVFCSQVDIWLLSQPLCVTMSKSYDIYHVNEILCLSSHLLPRVGDMSTM